MYLKDFLPPPCYAARSITTIGNHTRGSKEGVAWHGTEEVSMSATGDSEDFHMHQSTASLSLARSLARSLSLSLSLSLFIDIYIIYYYIIYEYMHTIAYTYVYVVVVLISICYI
jgi:hypothetical protein